MIVCHSYPFHCVPGAFHSLGSSDRYLCWANPELPCGRFLSNFNINLPHLFVLLPSSSNPVAALTCSAFHPVCSMLLTKRFTSVLVAMALAVLSIPFVEGSCIHDFPLTNLCHSPQVAGHDVPVNNFTYVGATGPLGWTSLSTPSTNKYPQR